MDDFHDSGHNSSDKSKEKSKPTDLQSTGRFIRPKKTESLPDLSDQPTQKIILFPTEKSQAQPNDDPSLTGKIPPILFSPPLPKVKELPKDFFAEGELDEHKPNPHKVPKPPPPSSSPVDFKKFFGSDSKEEKKMAQLMKELNEKADYFADNHFLPSESEDTQEVERLERLIPGTDYENGNRTSNAPSRQRVEVKKEPPKPPDISPSELGTKLGKGLKFLKIRRLFLSLLVLLSFVPLLFPDFLIEQAVEFQEQSNQILLLSVLLIVGFLSTCDLLFRGFLRGLKLKLGIDTLCLFSSIFCLLDCLIQYSSETPRGQLPYVSLLLTNYLFLLYGEEVKRRAHRKACRVATLIEEPYLITLEPNKWNGKGAYTKSSAKATGFTSQLQQDDGTQVVFAFTTPVFLVTGFFTAMNLTTNTADFVWAFSALLLVCTPFGASFIYGRPAEKIAKRLDGLRSSLAGWPGVSKACKQCIISDSDLFPAGSVIGRSSRIFEGNNKNKILAYTTALVTKGDLGCKRLFQEMMVVANLTPPKVKEVAYHEAGGISAKINNDDVLVGSAAFMELMEITVPEGLYVENAIFCCINRRLGGIYALDYNLPELVEHSVESLLIERIRPVLATRDFALTPSMLHHRFGLNTVRMDFPSILRRQELSRTQRPKEGRLTAVLSREGLEPVSDCVIAAGKLRRTVHYGIILSLLSSLLGFALVGYLVSVSAYSALSPTNLLIFMGLWLMPIFVMTDLPHRF